MQDNKLDKNNKIVETFWSKNDLPIVAQPVTHSVNVGLKMYISALLFFSVILFKVKFRVNAYTIANQK